MVLHHYCKKCMKDRGKGHALLHVMSRQLISMISEVVAWKCSVEKSRKSTLVQEIFAA